MEEGEDPDSLQHGGEESKSHRSRFFLSYHFIIIT